MSLPKEQCFSDFSLLLPSKSEEIEMSTLKMLVKKAGGGT